MMALTKSQTDTAQPTWATVYRSPQSGQLDLVTTFLLNGWAGTDYDVQPIQDDGSVVGQWVHLDTGERELYLLHNRSGEAITAGGFTTDGLALFMSDTSICTLNATQASLPLSTAPRSVHPFDSSIPWQRGEQWDWSNGTLTLRPPETSSVCLWVDY